ncbi:sulfite exporter TauE/SafE family protein [Arcicella rigui]|uniref:Urease accessory protein n=1 Tax=Arcicella rigui TaxID=797020 RepID=A0ABU5Q749_9BACT|nr:urease accessory protein [Arcicella rigui]MEA5138644.1 urease accessory protein [Arcicella rigui]
MDITLPILFASTVGFGHAFEADHLVAVSNLVSKRNKIELAIKDGIFWGLGHTSTILLVGSIVILGKLTFKEEDFRYEEAGVGLMLMLLGFFRIFKILNNKTKSQENQPHSHHHSHQNFSLAYGVGAIHGLAGSGALVLSVMTQIKGNANMLIYLLTFGLGSIFGMMVASAFFSFPFSSKVTQNKWVKLTLSVGSSLLCLVIGFSILKQNLSF